MGHIFGISFRLARHSSSRFSNYVLKLSSITLAVSLAAMLVSTSLVTGFRDAVSEKLYTIWGWYRVLPSLAANEVADSYYGNERLLSFEQSLSNKDVLYDAFSSLFALAQNAQGFTSGVILKGYSNAKRLAHFVDSGFSKLDSASLGVLISSSFARTLGLKVSDKLYLHFFMGESARSRIRKMFVAGIYNTGVKEHDQRMIYCDNAFFRRLGINGIGGYEIFPRQGTHKEEQEVRQLALSLPSGWVAISTREALPEFFDWMNFEKVTEWLFVAILSLLVFINLMGGYMLFVVDRSSTIGVLISLGYTRRMLYQFILYTGILWIARAILIGIVLAILLLATQYWWNWIRLDATFYYLSEAVVSIHPLNWLLIIGFVTLVSLLSLLIPAYIATSFSPSKVLRFS